jgi:hypothetical protein
LWYTIFFSREVFRCYAWKVFQSYPIINTFDIETFFDDTGRAVPYNVCYILNEKERYIYYTESGNKLILDFLNDIFSEIKNEPSKSVWFYIHNINFDGVLIIESLSYYKIQYNIFAVNMNLYYIEIYYSGICVKFRCSYKILPLSLRKLGEIEKIEKLYFPYSFVNLKTLNYEGEIPDKKF